MGWFNNIDVLQANFFSVRWWKTRQYYEDRCTFCGLKHPSAESQMGFINNQALPGEGWGIRKHPHMPLSPCYNPDREGRGLHFKFPTERFFTFKFQLWLFFFCQNIMVTVFPVFLCRTKPLIMLDFGQSISIITKGSPSRLFHFSGVFRFVDSLLSPFAPVWGQAGLAATLCWMSCWIWLSVKEWWTSTTVSRPSAPDASTWSRRKWVGGLTLLAISSHVSSSQCNRQNDKLLLAHIPYYFCIWMLRTLHFLCWKSLQINHFYSHGQQWRNQIQKPHYSEKVLWYKLNV